MNLPADFQFSQKNLQDYVDCHRRFQLKYLLKMEWPAPRTEPILEAEQQMLLGQRFHELMQQSFIGIPIKELEASIDDPILQLWWNNFQDRFGGSFQGQLFPEHILMCKIDGLNFIAKYDLVQIKPDSTVIIYDWKTTQFPPRLELIKRRLQSRVYPTLFILGASSFLSCPDFSVSNLQMIYWYPNFPELSLVIPTDDNKYNEDLAYIRELVKEIEGKDSTSFELTNEVKRCKYCNYRSLCDRGVSAGKLNEMETDEAVDDANLSEFNFENLQEIAY